MLFQGPESVKFSAEFSSLQCWRPRPSSFLQEAARTPCWMLFLSTAFSHKLGWKASCADFLQAEMVFAECPHCLIGSDCGHVAGVILKYTAGKVAGCLFPTGYRTKSRSRAREIASYARGVDCSIRSAPENCYGQTDTLSLSLTLQWQTACCSYQQLYDCCNGNKSCL